MLPIQRLKSHHGISRSIFSYTQVESERNGTTTSSHFGENFPHTINLDQTDMNGERIIRFDINLNKHQFHQEHLPVLDAVWCYLVIFLSALLKTAEGCLLLKADLSSWVTAQSGC